MPSILVKTRRQRSNTADIGQTPQTPAGGTEPPHRRTPPLVKYPSTLVEYRRYRSNTAETDAQRPAGPGRRIDGRRHGAVLPASPPLPRTRFPRRLPPVETGQMPRNWSNPRGSGQACGVCFSGTGETGPHHGGGARPKRDEAAEAPLVKSRRN